MNDITCLLDSLTEDSEDLEMDSQNESMTGLLGGLQAAFDEDLDYTEEWVTDEADSDPEPDQSDATWMWKRIKSDAVVNGSAMGELRLKLKPEPVHQPLNQMYG